MSWFYLLIGLWLAVLLPSNAVLGATRHIVISGATSVLPYLKAASVAFSRTHPDVAVAVTGGGSLAGLAALKRGRTDIAASDLSPEDFGFPSGRFRRIQLGRMPVVFVVNPDTGIGGITSAQLRRILSGEVANWAQVGGADRRVLLVERPRGSGARAAVDRRVNPPVDLPANAVVQLSNGAVLRTVAESPGAMGYIEGLVIPRDVRMIRVDGKDPRSNARSGWPYYTEPSLYVDTAWSRPVVRELVQFLATGRERMRFGIFPPTPNEGGGANDRASTQFGH